MGLPGGVNKKDKVTFWKQHEGKLTKFEGTVVGGGTRDLGKGDEEYLWVEYVDAGVTFREPYPLEAFHE